VRVLGLGNTKWSLIVASPQFTRYLKISIVRGKNIPYHDSLEKNSVMLRETQNRKHNL
jgi:hypothetical protein